MTDWIDGYVGSVSWADQVHRETVADLPCFWVLVRGQRYYRCPGLLGLLQASIDQGVVVKELTGCEVILIFLDECAEDREVEEALHKTAAAGLGCGFLHAGPCVQHYRLVRLRSEGTILDGFTT